MQLDRLTNTQFMFFPAGLVIPPCSFALIEKAPFPSGFGAFSFVANEEARQG